MEKGNADVYPQVVNTDPADDLGHGSQMVTRLYGVEGSRGQIRDHLLSSKKQVNRPFLSLPLPLEMVVSLIWNNSSKSRLIIVIFVCHLSRTMLSPMPMIHMPYYVPTYLPSISSYVTFFLTYYHL